MDVTSSECKLSNNKFIFSRNLTEADMQNGYAGKFLQVDLISGFRGFRSNFTIEVEFGLLELQNKLYKK